MRRSHFIIMFFIVFMGEMLTVGAELSLYFKVNIEKQKIDNALEYAFAAAGDTFSKYVYNDNCEVIVKDSFVYAYSAYMGQFTEYELEENSLLVENICFYVNGYPVDKSRLSAVNDNDYLGLEIKLAPIMITVGNRVVYLNRSAEGEVRGRV